MSEYATVGSNLHSNNLVIQMTRETVRDEFAKYFGAPERIVIDIDGERHEYDADMVVSALERYGRIAELESLVRDMRRFIGLSAEIPATVSGCKLIDERMHALGLEA